MGGRSTHNQAPHRAETAYFRKPVDGDKFIHSFIISSGFSRPLVVCSPLSSVPCSDDYVHLTGLPSCCFFRASDIILPRHSRAKRPVAIAYAITAHDLDVGLPCSSMRFTCRTHTSGLTTLHLGQITKGRARGFNQRAALIIPLCT